MNRQQFNSRNDIGQVLRFQKSGTTNSFDPAITFPTSSRRVSWRLDNGSQITQIAGNNITYTGFTSDNNIREIQIRGNSFKNISSFTLINDNLYGNLDLSSLPTFPTNFNVDQNINLTGITHCQSNNSISLYLAQSCGLADNLDLSPLLGFAGSFSVSNNSKLTGFTFPNVSNNISTFIVSNCNIIGNLDLTPLSGLSGTFAANGNPNLTGVTHSPTSSVFTLYQIFQCGLIGNLDLTPLSGLGGSFRVSNHPLQTGITHSNTTQIFTNYQVFQNNLIGNLDLTPIVNLGGVFNASNNLSLTGITHSPSNQNFSQFSVDNCNITGTYDLSIFTNLGGANIAASPCKLNLHLNNNLQNVIFPTVNTFFRNSNNDPGNAALSFYGCNLNYIDFKPLSGITLLTGTTQGNPRIQLENNNMSTTDVNHILVDFSGNTTYNPSGWSNVNLIIGGNNGDPDSSSGGYDGLAAISFLTGSPYNWTITY
jgi:hypothetical protein